MTGWAESEQSFHTYIAVQLEKKMGQDATCDLPIKLVFRKLSRTTSTFL